jgi:23S rRNA pseudouridine955/2504/2580 synthase
MPKITKESSQSSVQYTIIDEHHHGQRLDNYLLTRLKGLPKSHLYRIIRKGEVRVNKKRIKPDYRLQAGDNIRIPPLRLTQPSELPQKVSPHTQQFLTTRIIYEDKNLLVVNKPAGMAVHGGSGIRLGLIETLRALRPQEKFLELVHRLDRETSGCLLFAKKASVLKKLHELLREGKVEKIYTTLVKGYWPKHVYHVDAPLKKFQLRSGERMVNINSEGKEALTEFRVIKRFDLATLMEAKPLTGRTHQIRVHAMHAGHPIAADDKYGDKEFNKQMRSLGCKRLFLHASSLKFCLDEEWIEVGVELEKDLKEALAQL